MVNRNPRVRRLLWIDGVPTMRTSSVWISIIGPFGGSVMKYLKASGARPAPRANQVDFFKRSFMSPPEI